MRTFRIVASLLVMAALGAACPSFTGPEEEGTPEGAIVGPMMRDMSTGDANTCPDLGLKPGCDTGSSPVANEELVRSPRPPAR